MKILHNEYRQYLSSPESEIEYTKLIVKFLMNNGYKVRTEVPNLCQSTDIIATKNRWVTAIEVKINDWRRAIHQCKAHEIVADYICIAFCSNEISELALEEISKHGYGIIHYSKTNGLIRWVRYPQKNNNIWKPQRQQFLSNMRHIEYES